MSTSPTQKAPISITLQKTHPSQKLGITLGDDYDGSVRIVTIVPHSLADQSNLQLHDKILSINGQYILGNAHQAIDILRTIGVGELHVVVTRNRDVGLGMQIDIPTPVRGRTTPRRHPMVQDAPPWSELETLLNQSVKSLSDGQEVIDLNGLEEDVMSLNRTLSRSSTITTTFTTFHHDTSGHNLLMPQEDTKDNSLATFTSFHGDDGIYTVDLQKLTRYTKLGVHFATCTNGSVVVASLERGGEGYESLLKVGDRIISVDGQYVGRDLKGEEMVTYLKNVVGTVRIIAEASKGMVRMERLLEDEDSTSDQEEFELISLQNRQENNSKEYYICTTSAVIHQPLEKIQAFLFNHKSIPQWHRRVQSTELLNKGDSSFSTLEPSDTIKCTYYSGAHVLEDILHVSKREIRLAVQPQTIQTLLPIMEYVEKVIKVDPLGGNAANVTVSIKYRTKYMPWTKILAEGIIRGWMGADASAYANGIKHYAEKKEQVTMKTNLQDSIKFGTITEWK